MRELTLVLDIHNMDLSHGAVAAKGHVLVDLADFGNFFGTGMSEESDALTLGPGQRATVTIRPVVHLADPDASGHT